MTPGDRPDPALKALAAYWLELGDDVSRAALFRRLRNDDFLPDEIGHDAIRALCNRPVSASSWLAEEASRVDEASLRDEVERFAGEFFAIPPVERRARWRTLAARCKGHARLIDRLRELGRGLNVDRASFRDKSPLVVRLAGHACSLFVLRPGPRSISCRSLVRDLRADTTINDAQLSRGLKRLRRRHHAAAALAPEFLTRLAQPRRPRETRRWRTRSRVMLNLNLNDHSPLRIGIFVAFMVILALYAAITKDRNTSAGLGPPLSFDVDTRTTPPPTLPPFTIDQKPSAAFVRNFKDQFKAPIRSELEKLQKSIGDDELQRVVDALPAEDVPQAGLATLILVGTWAEDVRDRFASALRKELVASGIELDDAEFAQVAERCFPRAPGSVLQIPQLQQP